MPTQRLDDARLEGTSTFLLSSRLQTSRPSPRLQMSSYAGPLIRTQVMRPGAVSAEAEWPAEAFVDLGDLGRGVSWALAIEGAATLIVCAAWHLWELWR